MSKILVDELVNLAGTGSVTFAQGLEISNGETLSLDGATITLDTGIGLNDQLLASTGAGLKWVTFTNTNTTYDFAASGAAINDVRLRLTAGGSGTGIDEVVLQGSGASEVNLSGNVITVSSTDNNTTYDFTSTAVTSGVAFQLLGSDSTTDAVNLLEGSNINISRSGNDITISTILSGTVTGPSSATDGAVVLFDGTAGNLLKDSSLTVDVGGNLTIAGGITTASGTASLITFRYDQTGSFPNANSYQGALAYSDNNNAMYFASGNSWYQLARLTDIVPNTDTTYSVALTGSNFGLLTLTDSNGVTDSVQFYRSVYGGVELERSGENLYFDSRLYDLSAVTGGGNAATLRLTGLNHDSTGSVTNTTTDDISFAGANGITVTRTDANTITIDGTGAGGGTAYTDSDAKDAAAQSILNGTHLGISFTYDQASQSLNSVVTASGTGGGGGTAILYDFYGSNVTSNQVILNLDPSTGTTDTVEFAGAGGTTVSWDSQTNKATIQSDQPVQSDWNITDINSLAFIQNKPTIPTAYTLPAATTTTLGGVIPDGSSILLTSSGDISATLDSITDASNSTTNDLSAAGFTLNTNYTTVSGATGDIKRIGDLPYYHDGTDWRLFYLTGEPTSAAQTDVNFDDVQVRLTGATGGHSSDYIYNYVTGNWFAKGSNATVVSSPVKYGTNAIQFDGAQQSYISVGSKGPEEAPNLYALADNIKGSTAKRGGFPDFSGDWTIELWVRFDDLTASSNNHGIFSLSKVGGQYVGRGVGLSLVRNSNYAVDGGQPDWYSLHWSNNLSATQQGDTPTITAFQSFGAFNWQEDTWYHISVSRRASDGRLFCHVNGTYVESSNGAYYDTNLNVTITNEDYTFFIGQNSTQAYAAWNTVTYHDYLRGYVDDVRWTDYRRYDNTNYTAPTEAYPITAPAPPTVDPDWSNVLLRLPFDTNLNDVSSYENTGTLTAGATTAGFGVASTTVKYGAGALRTNTVNHRLFYGNGDAHLSLGVSTWTVEFWINFNSLPGYDGIYGGRHCIFSNTSGNSSSEDLGFGIWSATADNLSYRFYWRNANTASTLHYENIPSTVLFGGYNHVAVTRDSNDNIKVYLNGYRLRYNSADDAFFNDTSIPLTTGSDNIFTIGLPWDTVNAGEYGFNGFIDDFRFTSDVKYTENFTPPTGPLPTTGTVTADPGTPTTQSVGLTERTALQGSLTLDNNASGNLNITGYKAYTLLKVETDADAWVRIYTDDAARTADQSRNEGSDPVPGTGVIAETRGSGVIQLNPAPLGYNNDSPNIGDTIYTAVTNRSGSTSTITVTLTAIRLEA